MANWFEILGDYLTINKNFNRIDNELTKTNKKIDKLTERVGQNTYQINKLTGRIEDFPSKIKLICHEVFDEKVRTWKSGQQPPQLLE